MPILCSRKPDPLPGHLLGPTTGSDQEQKFSFSYCTSQNSSPRVMKLDQPGCARAYCMTRAAAQPGWSDRKSTRLNSSHITISYAVFCLKKKKNQTRETKSRPTS